MAARLHRDGCLCSPDDARRYAEARLRGFLAEVFAAFFLDDRHRVIAFEPLFRGTSTPPTSTRVRSCAACSCTTPPPSSSPTTTPPAPPSRLDHAITGRLAQALATVDVRVLDHLVVGDGETVSFAERGWL